MDAPPAERPASVNANVYVAPGTGYRDDTTTGIATGDQPEGEYALSGNGAVIGWR